MWQQGSRREGWKSKQIWHVWIFGASSRMTGSSSWIQPHPSRFGPFVLYSVVLWFAPVIFGSSLLLGVNAFLILPTSPSQEEKKSPSSPPEGSSPVSGMFSLRFPPERAQGLLQSLAVGLVSANHGLPLLLFLLVQEPQEVPQLRDGERVPLKKKKKHQIEPLSDARRSYEEEDVEKEGLPRLLRSAALAGRSWACRCRAPLAGEGTTAARHPLAYTHRLKRAHNISVCVCVWGGGSITTKTGKPAAAVCVFINVCTTGGRSLMASLHTFSNTHSHTHTIWLHDTRGMKRMRSPGSYPAPPCGTACRGRI